MSQEPADPEDLADRLLAAGLSAEAADRKATLLVRLAEALDALRPRPSSPGPRRSLFVPGRIEILGKHTDYAGGQSLTIAVEQGFCMVARSRGDRQMRVIDIADSACVQFRLAPDLEPSLGCWSNYPMTVARRLARNFPGIEDGADIALMSDLPGAAGMSSSSALMVGIYLILAQINNLSQRAEFLANIHGMADLASYLASIENGRSFGGLAGDLGVGTLGGSEDHTAILWSEPNQIGQYSYCPVALEKRLPVAPDCIFAVGVSGVVAEKTGAARQQYNTASRLVAALLAVWHGAGGGQESTLAAALRSSPGAADRLKSLLRSNCPFGFDPAVLERRLAHFLVENEEIIPQAAAALADDDRAAFGRLVDRSQEAAERLLGNQIPETSWLAAEARRQVALAASAFGAGFGGSVWALVERESALQFLAAWSAKYQEAFPELAGRSQFFITAAGPAAVWLRR